jgi:hypothetical protein
MASNDGCVILVNDILRTALLRVRAVGNTFFTFSATNGWTYKLDL